MQTSSMAGGSPPRQQDGRAGPSGQQITGPHAPTANRPVLLRSKRAAQAVVASGGFAAEAVCAAAFPFIGGDGLGVGGEVVVQDELAGSGLLGDAADLADVGVQCCHLGYLGVVHTVAAQVVQVGHLVDQDVGTLGQGGQVLVLGGVAG